MKKNEVKTIRKYDYKSSNGNYIMFEMTENGLFYKETFANGNAGSEEEIGFMINDENKFKEEVEKFIKEYEEMIIQWENQ